MTFNAEAFLETAVKAEMSTELPSLPEGEYEVELISIDPKATKNPKWLSVTLECYVNDEAVAQQLGKETNPFKWKFNMPVEINEEGGLAVGEGKNIIIGQMREAVGQNNPAKVWKITDLIGSAYLFKVGVRKDNNDNTRNEIKAVAPLGEAEVDA